MADPREILAYHEAGHAVAGLALGFKIDHATIVSTAPDRRGHVSFEGDATPGGTRLERAKRRLMVSLAGPLSETLLAMGPDEVMRQAATSVKLWWDKRISLPDFATVELAADFIAREVGQPPRTILERSATQLLTLMAHPFFWGCIQATAKELLACDTVTGVRVGQICAGLLPRRPGKVARWTTELTGDVPLVLRWVLHA